ncbi:isocitrate lyase/phosphoenolpyruvate mutase family protein [Bradyrhizobium sp. 180]|uniref:isocitrate lyase/phosphoenolpyruvate mutase family protein n=1 Tax=Bradyrhizobium sp. 180 TaxID=2782650 RepID=UPI001FF7C903|nr:isocitrate lyase/phosphoenolpyruvate mutase family protein [Bradyrhizobium sp. 180]
MEARAGLSATIAPRSGCKGTWASGLSIASSRGYRDANEASWTQLLQSVERIVASTEHLSLVAPAETGKEDMISRNRDAAFVQLPEVVRRPVVDGVGFNLVHHRSPALDTLLKRHVGRFLNSVCDLFGVVLDPPAAPRHR